MQQWGAQSLVSVFFFLFFLTKNKEGLPHRELHILGRLSPVQEQNLDWFSISGGLIIFSCEKAHLKQVCDPWRLLRKNGRVKAHTYPLCTGTSTLSLINIISDKMRHMWCKISCRSGRISTLLFISQTLDGHPGNNCILSWSVRMSPLKKRMTPFTYSLLDLGSSSEWR